MFSIIIPTFNNLEYLKILIKSLKKNDSWKLVKNFIKKISFLKKFIFILKNEKQYIFYDKRLNKPPVLNDCLSYVSLIKESCKHSNIANFK